MSLTPGDPCVSFSAPDFVMIYPQTSAAGINCYKNLWLHDTIWVIIILVWMSSCSPLSHLLMTHKAQSINIIILIKPRHYPGVRLIKLSQTPPALWWPWTLSHSPGCQGRALLDDCLKWSRLPLNICRPGSCSQDDSCSSNQWGFLAAEETLWHQDQHPPNILDSR